MCSLVSASLKVKKSARVVSSEINRTFGSRSAGAGSVVVESARTEAAWREAAGELAPYTRVGQVRGGKLEVIVSNSTVLQELTFRKPSLISDLAGRLPDEGIQDIRFRTGSVD